MENTIQKWNEKRIRLEELRKELTELQIEQDVLSKKIINYMKQTPNTRVQIDNKMLILREINEYPSLSQKFLFEALKTIIEKKEADKIISGILEYRKTKVKRTPELKFLAK